MWCAGQVNPKYISQLGPHTKWLIMEQKGGGSEAVELLNKEISELTKGGIPKLVELTSAEEKSLAFVLANALYFEAKWCVPFPQSLTRKKEFYSPYSKVKKVDMMNHGKEISALHANLDGTSLVELDYKKCENICMGLILPKDSQDKKKWESFIESFRLTKVDSLLKSAKIEAIKLEMPRFEAADKFDNLQNVLEAQGITTPFTSSEFDFSRATKGDQGLYVSRIIHQVNFKADECGTVASAATAVVSCKESCKKRMRDPISVTLNRPFLFYIRDRKQDLFPNGVLFLGIKSVQ